MSSSKTFGLDPRFLTIALGVLCALSLALLVLSARTPVSQGTYVSDTGKSGTFSFPFREHGDGSELFTVTFRVKTGAFHPSHYFFQADDCLESIEVNGEPVPAPGLPHCDYATGRTFDFSQYIQSGYNDVVVTVRNHGGDASLQFHASWTDATVLIFALIFAGFATAFGLFLLKRFRAPPYAYALFLILLAGVLLRTYYTLSTDYWVRGHDTDGHIEYVRYIDEHTKLPPPNEGWEFWQPPLYYTGGAAWMRAMSYIGYGDAWILRSLQFVSLLISILTLFIITETGFLLFDKRERPFVLPMFVAIASFFPSLVYMSARINNDIAVTLFSFLAFGLLVLWWKRPRMKTWIALAVTIALGILSKNTALLLVPVAGACLLLARGLPWKKKILWGVTMLFIIGVGAGWFSIWRKYYDESQSLIIGNENTLNSGLAVPNNPSAFLVFNPIEMVKHPYNSPWSDDERRQYFWEYFHRSAFTGEFMPGVNRMQVASWLLIWSFILMAIAAYGVWKGIRTRLYDVLPLLLLTVLLLAGHAVFRFRFPFSSSQDFRYSILLILPFAYFVTLGLQSLKNPLAQRIGIICAELFVVFSVISLIGL